jgi:hypothetical protein
MSALPKGISVSVVPEGNTEGKDLLKKWSSEWTLFADGEQVGFKGNPYF